MNHIKCLSASEWIKKKVIYINSETFFSLKKNKKRKEMLSHVKTWMKLEDIILSKISQSQKDKHFMIPLI